MAHSKVPLCGKMVAEELLCFHIDAPQAIVSPVSFAGSFHSLKFSFIILAEADYMDPVSDKLRGLER